MNEQTNESQVGWRLDGWENAWMYAFMYDGRRKQWPSDWTNEWKNTRITDWMNDQRMSEGINKWTTEPMDAFIACMHEKMDAANAYDTLPWVCLLLPLTVYWCALGVLYQTLAAAKIKKNALMFVLHVQRFILSFMYKSKLANREKYEPFLQLWRLPTLSKINENRKINPNKLNTRESTEQMEYSYWNSTFLKWGPSVARIE